jgi:hypothetical protein
MACPLAALKLFQFAVPLKEAAISGYGTKQDDIAVQHSFRY